jgi:hypothetical protein
MNGTRGGVYVLRDPATGRVLFVGRSRDLRRRAVYHHRMGPMGSLVFEMVVYTDEYAAQRGAEQIALDQADTIRSSGLT